MAHLENGRRAIYCGRFVHSESLEKLACLTRTAIGVDEQGVIVGIEEGEEESAAKETLLARLGWDLGEVDVLETGDKGEFFFPGFIDTHIHASQYPNAGIFGKTTLLDWLNTYTFPMESSLRDLDKARAVYERCVERTLSHGTTTASYYATIDVPSTNLLADICLARGQRAFVGRCCMDTDLQPAYYRDVSAAAALADTRASIAHIRALDPGATLLTPILTPRFAPSCSRALMTGLGMLHAEMGLPVQTHISENAGEIAMVQELFPDCESYAGVYDRHGLLGPKTILAHAVHLSEAEARLIRARGSKISHCPASNTAITSGEAKVRWLLGHGLEVGLGTDMSGGYSPSILEAARQACLVSRHVAMDGDDAAKLSIDEALFLATRGGAAVVGMTDKVGHFALGMHWDAQLIGLGADGPVDLFGWETWDEEIAKWMYGGDDRNTLKVWVKGKLVHKRL